MRVSAYVSAVMLTCAWCVVSGARLLVPMTLVPNAAPQEALCLDGSLPAYHLDRGFGAGAGNWLLQFEAGPNSRQRQPFIRHRRPAPGGGWCNDVESCLERAGTRRGSTRYMSKYEAFSGILSNNASLNPEKG